MLMVKMSDIHCSIVIRLGGAMLRRSTDGCVISGWRGVLIIFEHFFVATRYSNIKKQFA